MYEKNLTEDLRLRLTVEDMEFLRNLSAERGLTVSGCIRAIVGEYRRAVDTMKTLQGLITMSKENGGLLSNGDTKTNINDIV